MAINDFYYLSQALMRPTTVKVVMPEMRNPEYTMYFLHGVLSDPKNCIENIDVQMLADKYNMAIILPEGANSFYLDHGLAFGNYGRFVGSEIVEQTRSKFHLPNDREKTIIAGFSMGGFGAIRNGIKYGKNFGHIIGLSSVCLYEKSAKNLRKGKFSFFKLNMFDKIMVGKTDDGPFSENYKHLIRQELDQNRQIPYIYLACGLEDELLQVNIEFDDFLKEMNVAHQLMTSHGQHEWKYWKEQIEPAIRSCI